MAWHDLCHLGYAACDGRRRGLCQGARDAHESGRRVLRQVLPEGTCSPPVLCPGPSTLLAALLLLPDCYEAPHRLLQRVLVCCIPLPAMPGSCMHSKRTSPKLIVRHSPMSPKGCEGNCSYVKGSRTKHCCEDVGRKLLRVLIAVPQRMQQGCEQLWLHPQQPRQHSSAMPQVAAE